MLRGSINRCFKLHLCGISSSKDTLLVCLAFGMGMDDVEISGVGSTVVGYALWSLRAVGSATDVASFS
ncbi:hypothetical protein HanIR_Chr07g0333771 [Helianthus annuus]|nr:hypothetical protein HanIR_Chr07g0333771 [Helianthus annuus]